MYRLLGYGLLAFALSGKSASAETDAECAARTGNHSYCFHMRQHDHSRFHQPPGYTPPSATAPSSTPPISSQPQFSGRTEAERPRKSGSKCHYGIIDSDCWKETFEEESYAERKQRPKEQQSDIEVNYNFVACMMGVPVLYMEVMVDGEQFEFAPSCAVPFSASFTTKRKVRCKIESLMCSEVNSMNPTAMRIRCSDGATGGGFLQCKDK
jgi:hypothetical protein